MADDQRFYRSNDPPARGASGGAAEPPPGGDPLAELARLIGQNDPFGEFGTRRGLPPREPPVDWRSPPAETGYAPSTAAHGIEPYHPEPEAPDVADPHAPDYEAGLYYSTEARQDEPPEDIYDEAEPSRRRLGIIAIAAVFALAVIGTAGAFTYRAFYGSHASNSPPPVIKADTTPSKVVPAIKSKDPQSAKLIYDRVNERGQPEKLVSREEQPVELKDKPAGVLPSGDTGVQSGAQTPVLGSGVIGSDPKRIHTISIRPDQMGTAGSAPSAPPPSAAPASPPAPPQAAAPEAAPRSAPAAPPPARAQNSAPLSLNPNESAAAPAPARMPPPALRTATVSPAPAAAAPVRNGNLGAGSYVQISAQRSEAEAQSSYRSLQAKYPDQLGGRAATIHRADLGAKGIYFRALIGPFANATEAADICTKLKAAGGTCLIQRN